MVDPSGNGDPYAEYRKAIANIDRDLAALKEKGRRMNIRWAYIFGLFSLAFLLIAILAPLAWYLRPWWAIMAIVEAYMAFLAFKRAKRMSQ